MKKKYVIMAVMLVCFLLFPMFFRTLTPLEAVEQSKQEESSDNKNETKTADETQLLEENKITQTVRKDASSTRNVGRKAEDVFVKQAVVASMTDGVAPFDSDNTAGNDMNASNQLVRSFDSVSYGLLISLDSKDGAYYEDVVIKITGEIENGIAESGTLVNARFSEAFGGKVDLENKKSSFEYIIAKDSNGNSFNSNSMASVPLTLLVEGAKDKTKLAVDFKVEVIKVGNQAITSEKIITKSEKVTVSSKVNLKVYYGGEFKNAYFEYDDLSSTTGNKAHVISKGIAIGLTNLPGRSDMKGTYFPTGKISVKVVPSAKLSTTGGNVPIGFGPTSNANTLLPMRLLAYGSNGVEMENQLHGFTNYPKGMYSKTWVPYSSLTSTAYQEDLKVYDSGVMKATNNSDNTFTVEFNNYKVTDHFPTGSAGVSTGTVSYDLNKDRLFASGSMNLYEDYKVFDYYKESQNDLTFSLKSTEILYEEDGQTKKQGQTSSTTWNLKEYPEGAYFIRSRFNDNSFNSWGTSAYGWETKGDSATFKGNTGYIRLWMSKTLPIKGQTMLGKWNPNGVELDTSRAAGKLSGWTNDMGGAMNPTLKFGVSKTGQHDLNSIVNNRENDYFWYNTAAEALATKNPISAYIAIMPPNIMAGLIQNQSIKVPIKVIGQAGSVDEDGNPYITVGGLTGATATNKQVDSPFDSPSYKKFTPTIYDEDLNISDYQTPINLQGDTLLILPLITTISKKADKVNYTAGEQVTWTLTPGISLPEDNNIKQLVTIEDTLPKGAKYLDGSSRYKDADFPPDSVIENNDGTTTIRWKIDGIIKNNDLKSLTFKSTFNSIDLIFNAGVANLKNKVKITADGDMSSETSRTAYADIKVTKVNQMGVNKKVNTPLIESDGASNPLKYSLSTYNQMGTVVREVKGLDILPLTGYLGTALSGSYKLTALSSTNAIVELYYTTNSISPNTDPNTIIPTVANGWTKVTGTISVDAKAIFYVIPTLQDGEVVDVNIELELSGNKPGDVINNIVYLNSHLNTELTSSLQTTYVVNRKVEGFAWYDRNYDGLLSDGESFYSNLPLYLYKVTGTTLTKVTANLAGKLFVDGNGKSIVKTSPDGAYVFDGLPAGEYKIGFGIKNDVATKNLYVTAPKQGSLITINSKASQTETKDDSHLSVDSYELPVLSKITTPEYSQKYINIGVYKEAKLSLTKDVFDKKDNATRKNLKDKDVAVGQKLYYEMKIANPTKDSRLEDIVLTDELPVGVKYVPGSLIKKDHKGVETFLPDSQFTGQTLKLDDFDNLLGDKEYIIVGFEVTVGKLASGILTNTAKAEARVLKDKKANAQASVTTQVPPLPLLTKTTKVTEIEVGHEYDYSLTVENKKGGGKWLDVVVKDDLPSELVYVQNTTKVDNVAVGDDGAWTNNKLSLAIGDLESEAKRAVTFKVKLVKLPKNWKVLNIAEANGKDKDDKTYSPPKSQVETPISSIVLHLRQVVLGNDGKELVRPKTAFYELENKKVNSTSGSLQTYSVISGSSVYHKENEINQSLFTTRILTLDFLVKGVQIIPRIPEYYQYVGHVASTNQESVAKDHDSSQRVSSEPFLEYSLAKEYWVTIFIQPIFAEDETSPRPYSWETILNEFGKITK